MTEIKPHNGNIILGMFEVICIGKEIEIRYILNYNTDLVTFLECQRHAISECTKLT